MQMVYETDRLFLRILDESFAGRVLDFYERNKVHLDEWESVKDINFYSRKFQADQLSKDLASIEDNGSLRLWIFKKTDMNRVIGSVAFNNIVWGAFLSCHLGYKLDKDELKMGYMTEAIRKGIDIMFNEFGLHRIEANIMPRNKRSLRVVEKLGFVSEGMSPKYLKINDKWEDHVHMVLLNDKV